jgi:hypothetical protein
MSFLPKSESGDFKPVPAGTHLGLCIKVIDLGTQETKFGPKRQVKIVWELPEERMDDGRPFIVSKNYTFSGHEKSNLRKDLEAWRGMPFRDSDFGEGGFDIRNLLGKGCLVGVTHSENDGKTYANVTSVSKVMKGMQTPAPENEITFVWLKPADKFDPEAFESLSDKLKDFIRKSPEFRDLQQSPDLSHELEDSIPF